MPGPGGGTANLSGREGGAVALSNIPIPDPSLVTQQAIERTKNDLKEDTRALVHGLKTEVDINHRNREHSVAAQALLITEKFNVVNERFSRVDERFKTIEIVFKERRNQSQDDKAASDKAMLERGAFNSEAMRKSEDGFTARIVALEAAINSTKTNLETRLNDIKDRITALETSAITMRATRHDSQMTVGAVVGIVGAGVGALTLVLAMGLGIYSNSHPTVAAAVPVSQLVGADTKRLDDFILQVQEQNRAMNDRYNALSGRITNIPKTPP